jgi:hypothetical protein
MLQNKGFCWKLHFSGRIYPVTFRTYVPFVVGDTKGHDVVCGHYKFRMGNVAQLCRACTCPKLSGWSKSNFSLRKASDVKRLITNRDTELLQSMSQHYLANGLEGVTFGCRKCGIFGAVPGEILHLLLIGWFKYTIDSFITQAGSNSKATKKLCADIGNHLSRQSNQDMPRTNFPKGFLSGSQLMGEEIPGCLLVMLFSLHTSRYNEIFTTRAQHSQLDHPAFITHAMAHMAEANNNIKGNGAKVQENYQVADAHLQVCFTKTAWNGSKHHQNAFSLAYSRGYS